MNKFFKVFWIIMTSLFTLLTLLIGFIYFRIFNLGALIGIAIGLLIFSSFLLLIKMLKIKPVKRIKKKPEVEEVKESPKEEEIKEEETTDKPDISNTNSLGKESNQNYPRILKHVRVIEGGIINK